MIKRFAFLFFMLPVIVSAQSIGIDQWQYHLAFTSAFGITQNPEKIFVATSTSVFTIDKETEQISDFNKLNALSDVGISCINYDSINGFLLVGYINGNVDLVKDGFTFNINDIKTSTNIIGSKQINSALFVPDYTYVSTNFGIVLIDLVKFEIKETILLGENSIESPVFETTLKDDTLYAATANGLFFIDIDNPFISSVNFWTKFENLPDNHSNGPFTNVVEYKGFIFANYRNEDSGNNDVVYRLDNDGWSSILNNQTVRNLISTSSGIIICTNTPVFIRDENGGTIRNIWQFNDQFFKANDAIFDEDGTLWIADKQFTVIVDNNSEQYSIVPNGPKDDLSWSMSLFFGELWIAGGEVTATFGRAFNNNGVYHLSNGTWVNHNRESEQLLKDFNFRDVIAVAVNQNRPEQTFVGSFGRGLIEYINDSINRAWNADNIDETSLHLTKQGSDTSFFGIGGLNFDVNDNLWITNPGSDHPVSVLTHDGKWQDFSFGSSLNGNFTLGAVTVTYSSNQKWIIRPRSGILVFDDGGTPLNTSDDQFNALTTSVGDGDLPSLEVFAITEDLDGEIWVGTAKGPAVFFSPRNIFDGGNFDSRQILIEQDGNVQILLETETVTAIAIDGGNRKWMGTLNSGVFLFSPDGIDEIHHFTKENSPLLSNDIQAIVLDHLTGEVYISTSLGLVSYRSDATAPPLEVDQLKVYPNPVRQDYFGPIAIDGVASNSSVKITDETGNIVNLLISEGGQAVWYGTDFNGDRVATGVYFIYATDRTGKKKASGKVLIIK